MAEYWDIIDRDRRPVGRTVKRGDRLERGEYHLAVSVWTINDRDELLLTLRSSEKEAYPNLWENTAGAVLAGEESRQAAVRELREETGILAEENELFLLGVQRRAHMFVDTYALRRNVPEEEIRLQPGEKSAAQFVSIEKFKKLVRSGLVAKPVVDRLAEMQEAFETFLKKK